MTRESTIDRRTVLEATGGALAGLGATGLASASPDELVEVNVGFDSTQGRSAALDAAEAVVREFAFDALTIRAPEQAVSGLRRRPGVRYVEANGRMHALDHDVPWNVDRIDAPRAHDCGYTGWGADVAIVDTGIDSDHPDLQGNLGRGYATSSCSSWYAEDVGLDSNETGCGVVNAGNAVGC